MEAANNTDVVPEKASNFISYITTFDKDAKADLLNLLQFSCIGIIPAILLSKLLEHFAKPDDYNMEDDSTHSYIEALGLFIAVIGGIWIIDKSIRYIQPYSKQPYPSTSLSWVVPILLMIVNKYSLHDTIGKKLHAMVDTVLGSKEKHPSVVRKVPSISHIDSTPNILGPPAPISTQKNTNTQAPPPLLPTNSDLTKMPSFQDTDPSVAYNTSHNTNVVSETPSNEPIAANELSGAAGSSW